MRKIIFILICSFSLTTILSCDDFLGNEPKGYTIPKYYEDYALLMNGQTLNFMSDIFPYLLTDDIIVGGKWAPSYGSFINRSEEEQNCYTFKSGDIFPQGINDKYYTSVYSKIFTFNVVANNIMKVTDATEENKQVLRAEALTHRAFAYLQLVNIYATHYDKNTASSDYGVPLILNEDINQTYTRNSVAEVYAKIISDLQEAVKYLPVTASNSYHANKTAGYAILARTYLYMGEYKLALEAEKKALELNKNKMVDYTKYTVKQYGSFGRVIDENGVAFQDKSRNPQNIFVQLPSTDLSSSIFASKELISVFKSDIPENSVDKRFELFYAKDKAYTYSPMSFPGYTMYIAHIQFSMGITVPELYITLAECEARVGSVDAAIEYLNNFRKYRITNYKPIKTAGKEEILQIALNERRKEFAFCGHLRLIDLKRLNKEPKFAKKVIHELDGQLYELPENDVRYIFPLPYSVREFNPSIPQYKR